MRSLTLAAVVASLLVCTQLGAAEMQHRGIPVNLGDTVLTDITPAGDVDTVVFDAHKGTKFSITLSPGKSSELIPTIEILAPSGDKVGEGAFTTKKSKTFLKSFVLTESGRYAVIVTGQDGTTGGFKLKTKGKFPKKVVTEGTQLAPGEEVRFLFPAEEDASAAISIKGDGAGYMVDSVFDPEGNGLPGQEKFFDYKKANAKGTVFPFGSFGDFGITVADATAPVVLDVTIKVKHAKVRNWKRQISSLEPEIELLLPEFGREGDPIEILGKNFVGGDGLTVFLGAGEARNLAFSSENLITALAPAGLGEVTATVYNPDGQEGVKEKAFTFIPDPPKVSLINPVEGPTGGGTTITVFGENLTFIESVTIGSTEITEIVPIDERSLSFTTVEHPVPGLVSVTVRDRWDRTAVVFGAFTFNAPPAPTVIDPLAGTKNGGSDCILLGEHFRSDDRVFFNTLEVTPVTFVSSTRLEFRTPSFPKGYVDVKVENIWGYFGMIDDAFEFNDGTFIDRTETQATQNTSDERFGGVTLRLGDTDGDDDPDLLTGRPNTGLGAPTIVSENDGIGDFKLNDDVTFEDLVVGYYGNSVAKPFTALDLVLGDLDGDEDLDVVVTREGYYVVSQYYVQKSGTWYWYYSIPFSPTRVFLNDGKGYFSHKDDAIFDPFDRDSGADLMQGTALAVGDLDDDEDLDLVVTWNQNVGTVDSYNYPTWGPYYYTFKVYFNEDMAATRVLLNDGKANFTHETDALPSIEDGDMFAGDAVAVGDVDGDDVPDIIITGDSSYLRDSKGPEYVQGSKTRLLINEGEGTFENATKTLFPGTKTGDDWGGVAIALGDLDGDGETDLVISKDAPVSYVRGDGVEIHHSSTRVFIWDGTAFKERTSTHLPAVRPDGLGDMWFASDVVIADPDGDGMNDLFLVSEGDVSVTGAGGSESKRSSLRWLFNAGNTPLMDLTAKGIPNPERRGDYYKAEVMVLGDIDGDDDLDLIISTTWLGYVSEDDFPTRVFEFQ